MARAARDARDEQHRKLRRSDRDAHGDLREGREDVAPYAPKRRERHVDLRAAHRAARDLDERARAADEESDATLAVDLEPYAAAVAVVPITCRERNAVRKMDLSGAFQG